MSTNVSRHRVEGLVRTALEAVSDRLGRPVRIERLELQLDANELPTVQEIVEEITRRLDEPLFEIDEGGDRWRT